MRTLTALQLAAVPAADRPLLVHVLPEEHFAARRIAGAVNACSYETAFLARIGELSAGTHTPIIVYGEGAPSLDSADAAAKLEAAGYTDVTDFRGGLREWESAGFPIDDGAALPSPPVPDGRFEVDVAASFIRWTGQNLFNHHEGTVRLASGSLLLDQGNPLKAEITVDMDSIACSDLTDNVVNRMLIGHLRTADFFDADHHPTATFMMTAITPIPDATAGSSTHRISGEFTLRGVTRELEFPAVVAVADPGHLTAQAHLSLDRTLFGSLYGSGKFFAFLGKHVVNDLIQIHLKITAVRG